MSGPGRDPAQPSFSLDEIAGVVEERPMRDADAAARPGIGADPTGFAATARALEVMARRGSVTPSAGFADRVMRAVAAEPSPAPGRVALAALASARVADLARSIRDAARLLVRPGVPAVARAQALAVIVVAASVVGGGGFAGAAALGLIETGPVPTPTIPVPGPSVEPSPTPALVPTPSATPEPTETVEPTPTSTSSPRPTRSPEPTDDETPEPGETESPEGTDKPDDD